MSNRLMWRKGNLHTHTTNSDGDSAPEHVAGWYEEHGYDWLCISDHNHLTVLKQAESGSPNRRGDSPRTVGRAGGRRRHGCLPRQR